MNFESVEQAQKLWQYLPPEQQAEAHEYVVRAKSGSGETYNPTTGAWSKPTSTSTPGGYSAPKQTTPTKQNYVPGQKSWEDAISNISYTPRSFSDMQDEASTLADLQINPQLTQLQASLKKAIADAGNQKLNIEANYASVQPTAERLLEQAQKSGTESAIARGGGRSGAVEYEVGQMKRPINESVMQAEAKKAAELTGVDNSLATVNENYAQQVQALETHRGTLVAAQLAALKSGDTEMAMRIASERANLELQASTLLDNRDRSDRQFELDQSSIYGKSAGITGTVTLTDYLVSKGQSAPSWDPNTGNVSINGKTYTPEQLSSPDVGGYIQGGRWQLPESVVKSMM